LGVDNLDKLDIQELIKNVKEKLELKKIRTSSC
jgi:hypothetical protein